MITRLKDTFVRGGWGPNAEWFNVVARWLNGMRCINGTVTPYPDGIEIDPRNGYGIAAGSVLFSFLCKIDPFETGIIMEPGDVIFEPGDNGESPSQWIPWVSITGYTITPAVTSTDVCAWLSINVEALSAEMMVGSESAMKAYIAGLSSEDKKITTMRPLVITEWTDGKISKIKNLQCGDVIISRL